MPENNEPRNLWEFDAESVVINNNVREVGRLRIVQEEAINRLRQRRRINTSGQVLDTVGIELESLGLTRDRVARILGNLINGLGNNFSVHRDGSSEMNAYHVALGNEKNAVFVNSHTEAAKDLFGRNGNLVTTGYELISSPLDISTAEETLYALLPTLEYSGDFISERCATHIHVGAMKNLGFCKNALKLGLWFDEVFYSLAHMDGDKFRGYSNNAIYARPIVNGPYFQYERGYYQVLNWERALEADDLYEFFAAYGVNIESELPKYHPGRYFSINLYSIPRIGTLEFRHFNQTFNPVLVSAIAKLTQLFVEVAMKVRFKDLKNFEPADVFQLRSPSHYITKLNHLLDLGKELDCEYFLEDYEFIELQRVIYSYNGIGVENVEVYTHCTDFNIGRNLINDGGLKKSRNKPIKDGHVDIHNIKWQSIIK
jgi:hypothetical protein